MQNIADVMRCNAHEANQTIEAYCVDRLRDVWPDEDAARLMLAALCRLAAADDRLGGGQLHLAEQTFAADHAVDADQAVRR